MTDGGGFERPNEMVSVEVAAGRNAVLCRLEQTSRVFQFSLNVVAADPDTLANRHHRIKGLKFSVPGPVSVRDVLAQDMRFPRLVGDAGSVARPRIGESDPIRFGCR